jgi:phosphatidylglycerol:prolipoprotein diacylglycerol transferase
MLFHFNLDPVAITVAGLSIHWYGLCFATGVWIVCFLLESDHSFQCLFKSKKQLDSFILVLLIGTMIGAKLGYLAFYTPQHLLFETLFSLSGLSFHGAVMGVVLAIFIFSAHSQIAFIRLTDRAAFYTPLGLFFGRIGNFLNSELWGRPTGEPWGIIFEKTDKLLLPRHPSQLYEAFGEGLLLWILLRAISKRYKFDGLLSSSFMIGYGLLRLIIEQWRQPDAHIGFVLTVKVQTLLISLTFFALITRQRLGIIFFLLVSLYLYYQAYWHHILFEMTMGQSLCAMMIAIGSFMALYYSKKKEIS